MEPDEVITVDTRVIGCNGGGGSLGHPMIYLNMTKTGFVDCPYCSRRYVLKEGAAAAGGH